MTIKTRGRYRNVFVRMFKDFRGMYFPKVDCPAKLTLSFFREYRNYYSVELDRSTGLRTELIFVKATMHRLYQLGYCSKELIDSLKSLKKPAAKQKEYPDVKIKDIDQIFNYMKNDRRDYYYLLSYIRYTGRRIQESILIEKRDIVMRGFKPVKVNIRAETTKTGENAPLECLSKAVESVIRGALNNNKTKYVFPNRLNNKCTDNRVRDYLKKISSELIGVTLTPHYFRHRICTELGNQNVPIPVVKAITGIKDTDVLLKYYTHATEDGIKRAFELTEGKI